MITNLAARPLLEQNPAPPVQGPEFGGSSPVALVVTLLLFIALIVLIRSMNKHLRKVPASFDPAERESAGGSTPAPGSPGSVPDRRTPARDGASADETNPTDETNPADETSEAGKTSEAGETSEAGTPADEGAPAPTAGGGPGAGDAGARASTDERG
jgi:hypothetical protein